MTVRFEVEDGIGTITLNRPDKLNALSNELSRDLLDVLTRVAADDEVRGVMITGAGRAFSAGGDLDGMQRHVDSGVDHGNRPVISAFGEVGIDELLETGQRVIASDLRQMSVVDEEKDVAAKALDFRHHRALLGGRWRSAFDGIEIRDRLRRAVFEDLEVGGGETRHDATVTDHGHVDIHQGDVDLPGEGLRLWLLR